MFLTWRLHDTLPRHRAFPYNRLVRNDQEFDRVRNYIERNAVRAGLVREAGAYRWATAPAGEGVRSTDEGVRPTEGR